MTLTVSPAVMKVMVVEGDDRHARIRFLMTTRTNQARQRFSRLYKVTWVRVVTSVTHTVTNSLCRVSAAEPVQKAIHETTCN